VTSLTTVNRDARSGRRSDQLGAKRATSSGTQTRFALPVILIVDDNEDNRDLFAMMLSRLGYEIELAIDGQDGVERARAVRPSVILMDLAMPNMDGFEATRWIRAIPELASVRIIAVTASYDTVSAQRARAAGCDEVLAKPCAPEDLTACVEAGLPASHRSRDAS